jgi:tetratricopeptide (TPR) repeat protein
MGVRLTASKTGLGMSAGIPGMRYSVHSSGRKTRSIGIPGSGLSYVKSATASSDGNSDGNGDGKTPADSARSSAPPVDGAARLPKPGLFASRLEKRYHEGVHALIQGDTSSALDAFGAVLAMDPEVPSAHLFSALAVGRTSGPEAMQIGHLEAAVASRVEMPDRLQAKYLPPGRVHMGLTLKITDMVSAQAPFDLIGATLMLAEHYQRVGRLDEAIGLVQRLHAANPADTCIMLALADLLFADKDYEAVVELTRNASNDNDRGVALLHLRGRALLALRRHHAAVASLRDALAKTANRDPELLKAVRYDRALAYEGVGDESRARKDLGRVFTMDPNYADVRERLASSATQGSGAPQERHS